MPINITLPRLGWSMEEGKFLAWLKKDGDYIKEGDPLFTLESDKAAQEVEAIVSGLLHIAPNGPNPGDVIKVGHVLGYLLAEGEAMPVATAPTVPTAPLHVETTIPISDPIPEPIVKPITKPMPEETPASPRARRAAKEHRVDLATLTPTGNGGRIRERDILAAATSTSTSGMKQVPLTPMRRTIAARLMHSRQTTVPVTITARCDATALLAFRQELKSLSSLLQHSIPTINDILVKLAAAALREHPMLAATWAEDHLLLPESIHLGIAVDTEAGLLVPVIRDVGTSTLTQIAAQSHKLISAARAGQLAAADMQGGCFTLSNLGSLGVEAFTPVINPPESAILGIGAIVREAVPLDDGTFIARDRLTLSLTFDHRVNDGAAAARFLQTLRHLIEHPLLGLV
ncbi:MAG: Dihydrolipoyllysine-residue succinyltransferase component of 2-oxoglutarate dehydrogenase complex [Verrucomicrobiota bacterium]|jgi:pyruvate dehydrogenase E2 component (dihydrolipoamide acetyltransferase)